MYKIISKTLKAKISTVQLKADILTHPILNVGGYDRIIFVEELPAVGVVNTLYVDVILLTFSLWDGVGFVNVGGSDALQPDWLQSDFSQLDYIKNKPYKLSDFTNDLPTIDVLGTKLTGLTESATLTNLTAADTILSASGKMKKLFSSLNVFAFRDSINVDPLTISGNGNDVPLTVIGGTYTQVTLTVANWASKKQTVAVTGVIASGEVNESKITISPEKTRANLLAYGSAQVSCITQATNALTFECTTVPTIDLTVNLYIL